MSCESDQEIVQLVGTDYKYLNGIAHSLDKCSQLGIFTKEQALVSYYLFFLIFLLTFEKKGLYRWKTY